MRIAIMNLVLHRIRKANVKRADTLSDMGGLTEDDLNRRYKVILSNPPFTGVLPKETIRKYLPTNSKKSELLFVDVMMEALVPSGGCAVVVPEGLLFGPQEPTWSCAASSWRTTTSWAWYRCPQACSNPMPGSKLEYSFSDVSQQVVNKIKGPSIRKRSGSRSSAPTVLFGTRFRAAVGPRRQSETTSPIFWPSGVNTRRRVTRACPVWKRAPCSVSARKNHVAGGRRLKPSWRTATISRLAGPNRRSRKRLRTRIRRVDP